MKEDQPRTIAPAGWRLVPEEPTEAMIEAGHHATSAWLNIAGSALTVAREKARLRYCAMLAKAPTFSGH